MRPGRKRTGVRKRAIQAFTLIELMLTIAIIASLAAMLMPQLRKAKEKSKQSRCISNLKNIGQAVAMYAADFQDSIPIGPPIDCSASATIYDASGSGPMNHGLLIAQGYLPKRESFFCPAANYYSIDGVDGAQNWGSGAVVSSYLWRNTSGNGSDLTTFSSYGAHKAIALDLNQYAFLDRYNHQQTYVNVLFGDGHCRGVADPNSDSCSLGDVDLIFTWADDQS